MDSVIDALLIFASGFLAVICTSMAFRLWRGDYDQYLTRQPGIAVDRRTNTWVITG